MGCAGDGLILKVLIAAFIFIIRVNKIGRPGAGKRRNISGSQQSTSLSQARMLDLDIRLLEAVALLHAVVIRHLNHLMGCRPPS